MSNPDDRYVIQIGEAPAQTALERAMDRAQAIRVPLEIPAAAPAPVGEFVEVVRSFAYKLFLARFESRDFFCSQKVTCKPSDAAWAAEAAQAFCESEVLASVKAYRQKWEQQQAKKAATA